MDVKQLKYFVAIVDCESFSQASRELNIAQPALSQQISRLEYDVGAPLLLRSSRGVTPTSKGLTLYRNAKFILRQIDQALAAARGATTEITGRVTIGIPPSTICQVGEPMVERIRSQYPGIMLNVIEGLSGHLRNQAAAGDLDITVLFSGESVPGWSSVQLLREELFLVLPAASELLPLTQQDVTLADVARLPLILPSGSHGLRRRIDLEYERIDRPVVPVAEIDSLPVLMRCLLRGMGATIKPRAAINVFGEREAAQWRCLPIRDVTLTRVNYLHTAPTDELSEAAAIVRDALIDLVREQVSEGRWLGVDYIGPSAASG